MNLKYIAAALAVTAGALAGTAQAAPAAITVPPDLASATFTNFDWAETGTAFTNGFVPVAGATFNITYFSTLAAIRNSINLSTLPTPNLDTSPNGAANGAYEFTTIATLTERVFSCDSNSCKFDVLGGSFNVFYDTAQNANNNGGTGFGDGKLIISGSAFATSNGLGGTFATDPTGSGTGNATLRGVVNFTQTVCDASNPVCISPALTGTTFGTQLALGDSRTSQPANGFNGNAFVAANPATGAGNFVFQADGNQSFVVPEPDSLAILGLGVGLMALTLRRRRQG